LSAVMTVREEAAARFEQLGWPTPKIEEWRYTNLAPVQKIAWRVDDAPATVESTASLAGKATLELTFVNGRSCGAGGGGGGGGGARARAGPLHKDGSQSPTGSATPWSR
jgi:hypothetical protein